MYILFNIGGTNLRIGVSKDGQTIAKSVVKPTPGDYKEGLALIESLAIELAEGEKIEGIAGGIAGRLNDDKSGLYASNLPYWRDQPLRDDLKTKFSCTVILENDTAVEAIGESRFGSGQGLDILAYLSIGTGVGGARVIANQLDH
ncbi:MAG TPA: ROK family protein, partial [Flavobacterium sp.]|nr:ROK family protein [Flavobacterium sp.]